MFSKRKVTLLDAQVENGLLHLWVSIEDGRPFHGVLEIDELNLNTEYEVEEGDPRSGRGYRHTGRERRDMTATLKGWFTDGPSPIDVAGHQRLPGS